MILGLAVLVELRLVTDRQTDRRTQAMASTEDALHRAVKIASVCFIEKYVYMFALEMAT